MLSCRAEVPKIVNGIKQWLEDLDLSRYAEAFQTNAVDMELLSDLDEADLEKLGVAALGHRKKLLRAIEALRAPPLSDEARSSDVTVPPHADAERRQLTLMFCDLVGSTALSQQLDPEDLREVMRCYQDAVAGAVTRYQGHVAKFLGDGVLAYFGWPQAYEDQAERAIRAGLNAVTAVQAVRRAGENRTLRARVGIATGQVVVGDLVGETASHMQAVTGATPNLAARLQGAAEAGQVVIGSATRRLIGATFDLIELGGLDLKGFSEAVPAWGVIGESAMQSRFDASHTGTLTRLVGREHELGLLVARWDMAKNGEGQVMLLSGEAGIGKSRMLQALRDEISEQHYFHLSYQCTPHHTNSAFYPIIRRLERAAGFFAEDDNETRLDKLETFLKPTAGDLDAIALPFAALLSLPGDHRYGSHELTPQQLRDRTVAALIDQVLALSRLRPVLFALEDEHWIDPSTESLVGEIMSRTTDAAVFMLITHRPNYEPPWTGHTHQASMTLSRLSRNQGTEIVRDIGGRAMSDGMIEGIIARADGVPLYVEELAKSIAEFGATAEDQNLEVKIPETLQASLIARLDHLGEAKNIAQIGAVIGREFPYALIAAATETAGRELDNALDRILASELIFCRGTPPEAVYTFKHALIQDAAYESLLMSRRKELHHRIARILSDRFSDKSALEPELLAYHYTAAGDTEQASKFWARAGQMAVDRFAYLEATAHLAKSLQLQLSLPETPERLYQELDLQTMLGPVLMATKGYGSVEAKYAYLRAREICEKIDDARRLKPALVGLRYVSQIRGDTQAARKLGLQCLDLANRTDDRVLFVQANVSLGHTACIDGNFGEARDYLQQCIDTYVPAQHSAHLRLSGLDPGVFGLAIAGWNHWFLGYPDRALQSATRALALARQLNHPQSIEHALNSTAYTHVLRGEVDDVLKCAEAAINISREHGFEYRIAMAGILCGWARSVKGEHDHAIAELSNSLSALRETGARTWTAFYLTLIGEAYCRAARIDEGLATVQEAFELSQSCDEYWWDAERQRQLGRMLERRATPDLEQAEQAYKQSIKIARDQSAKSWELRATTSLARLRQRQNRNAEALKVLRPVYDWFTEGFETPDLKDAKSILDELA